MRQFRYSQTDKWFKGNTHIHSTASDGGKTFKELADMYAAAEYDFLFRTDHWVVSDVNGDADEYPLLWLNGVELDGHDETGSYFHVVCLGDIRNINREDGFIAGWESAKEQGALCILAHPHWSGNTFDDIHRRPFDGVEVYNHICRWSNGKSEGLPYWDSAMRINPDTLGFAVDDAHVRPEHPGWNGGWIVVNAPECTAPAIMDAIKRGKFYSSCGPEIYEFIWDGESLRITTSPVQFIRIVGPGPYGDRLGSFSKKRMTDVRVAVPDDWDYVYLEIEDDAGNRAWTNNLFLG